MGLFRRIFAHDEEQTVNQDSDAPPEWAPAVERSRTFGLYNEAPEEEYKAAEEFCRNNPPWAPRFLPSAVVEHIQEEGCKAWELETPQLRRFKGKVVNGSSRKQKVCEVWTEKDCGDSCIMSNLPIMGGLYDVHGKEGVYFEVTIKKMDGIIAIGICSSFIFMAKRLIFG